MREKATAVVERERGLGGQWGVRFRTTLRPWLRNRAAGKGRQVQDGAHLQEQHTSAVVLPVCCVWVSARRAAHSARLMIAVEMSAACSGRHDADTRRPRRLPVERQPKRCGGQLWRQRDVGIRVKNIYVYMFN